MRILVIGDGKVGHTLVEHLAQEGHDVVIIDSNDEVLERTQDTLDVMCIRGNGANAQTLMDAGAKKADIIIAATASDETNMLCCLIGKRMGAKYSIARIRDPEYNESLSMLRHELDIDMAINPERATAVEIGHLLRFPFAANVESFARGRVEMVGFRAQEGDPFIGLPMKDISRELKGIPQVLYALVEREGQVMIPVGDFSIRPGDLVHVAGDSITITNYFRYLGKSSVKIKDVMLLGGGRISYYLARILVPTGTRVSMIEIDPKKAEQLSEALPEVNVIYGDGTDQELLEQEGLRQMDAFVTLSNRDEENLMTGLFAVSAPWAWTAWSARAPSPAPTSCAMSAPAPTAARAPWWKSCTAWWAARPRRWSSQPRRVIPTSASRSKTLTAARIPWWPSSCASGR